MFRASPNKRPRTVTNNKIISSPGDSLPVSPLVIPGLTSRSDFISIITHQLKTPLAGSKWALNFMLGGSVGPLSSPQRDLVEKVYQSNERAIRLIDDMLRADKEESEIFTFHPTEVSVSGLIENIIRELSPIAMKKDVRFEFIKSKDTIPAVLADPEKMDYVFENLLENAIHYTKNGGSVIISVGQEDGAVLISITDTGIGIPKTDQTHIFKKFFRAANARKTESGGTGLGLFITKKIIEEHGGSIWFKSIEGSGTTFSVALPVARVVY